MNHKLIIVVIALQVITLFAIKLYSKMLTNSLKYSQIGDEEDSKECKDKLNHTFLTLKLCIWNTSHVFSFFICCLIFKPVTLEDHICIFMLGVFWYLMQHFSNKDTIGNIQKCLNVAYHNMRHPRIDDFIYNTFGQLLYICYIYFLMIKVHRVTCN
jgi:hypothetical protein